jgi:hypothetical protein
MSKKSWTKGRLAAIAAVAFVAISVPIALNQGPAEPEPNNPTTIVETEDVPLQIADAVQQREGVLYDYKGIDHPQRLMETIKERSENNVTFVMFHDPQCPHCEDLKQYFKDSEGITDLEYDVLLVNVGDYYRTVVALGAAKEGVPETYIFNQGEALGYFGGALEFGVLVDLLEQIHNDVTSQELDNATQSSAAPVAKPQQIATPGTPCCK